MPLPLAIRDSRTLPQGVVYPPSSRAPRRFLLQRPWKRCPGVPSRTPSPPSARGAARYIFHPLSPPLLGIWVRMQPLHVFVAAIARARAVLQPWDAAHTYVYPSPSILGANEVRADERKTLSSALRRRFLPPLGFLLHTPHARVPDRRPHFPLPCVHRALRPTNTRIPALALLLLPHPQTTMPSHPRRTYADRVGMLPGMQNLQALPPPQQIPPDPPVVITSHPHAYIRTPDLHLHIHLLFPSIGYSTKPPAAIFVRDGAESPILPIVLFLHAAPQYASRRDPPNSALGVIPRALQKNVAEITLNARRAGDGGTYDAIRADHHNSQRVNWYSGEGEPSKMST
ncbi:hypothetical protein C8R47DRAFT_1230576 [Mycena vitilis]|nr:hypothetical protein C8R47DRAFT_1230576 [Mycena vitilis]